MQVSAQSVAFLNLISNPAAELTVAGVQGTIIENEEAELELLEVQEEYVVFKLTNKKTGDCNFVNFGFRFWPSYEWSYQPSGVYIFRPKNVNDSIMYNSMIKAEVYKGNTTQQLFLKFEGDQSRYGIISTVFVTLFLLVSLVLLYVGHRIFPDSLTKQLLVLGVNSIIFIVLITTFTLYRNINGDATVRVNIDSSSTLKFDVLLGSIPMNREVTANFYAPEIDNENTFYTDSNGLAMQKRILNYRPTWDLQTKQNE